MWYLSWDKAIIGGRSGLDEEEGTGDGKEKEVEGAKQGWKGKIRTDPVQ